jgi:hypothetical protein
LSARSLFLSTSLSSRSEYGPTVALRQGSASSASLRKKRAFWALSQDQRMLIWKRHGVLA